MALAKGQKVLIKNPGALMGMVIGPRPGDSGLPEEQSLYAVMVCEEKPRYYLSSDLEPVEEPSRPTKLEWYSEEWVDELDRFTQIVRQLSKDPEGKMLRSLLEESATKLGFIIASG